MEIRKENVGKMETQLQEWGAALDDLVEKSERSEQEVKGDYRKALNTARDKHLSAKNRFEQMKRSGSEKWSAFKDDLEYAWMELETAFKNLRS